MKPAHATRWVVLCTHGITDPLVSGLMLDYIRRLQRGPVAREILFITEEPPNAVVRPDLRAELAGSGIHWIGLHYDVGSRQWVQKARNLWLVWRHARRYLRGARERWLVGYLAFGGAYAWLLSVLGLGRCATVCFEPHSLYMVEMGIWGRRSPKAMLMGWLERMQMRRSHRLIVPTTAGERLALSLGRQLPMARQEITIDVPHGRFDAAARVRIRQDLSIPEAAVTVIYVGKFGGIYYTIGDYLRFVERVRNARPAIRHLIVSGGSDLDGIRHHPTYQRVMDVLTLHPPVPQDLLHEVLSAADWGVVAVPPTPAQAFRTPVKSAHYWAAGLPIIIPRGVSDDHVVAEQEKVGAVVDDLVTADMEALLAAMDTLRTMDPRELRERCMQVALRHRDSALMVRVLEKMLS